MRILVDADSLSARLREIIARASGRTGARAFFVANRTLPTPESFARGSDARPQVEMIVAPDADEWIAARAGAGDLVVTRDVPLAARVVARGAEVITDRGDHFTHENVGERLSERDAAMAFREAGLLEERARPSGRHGPREVQGFANVLDRVLRALAREEQTSRSERVEKPE